MTRNPPCGQHDSSQQYAYSQYYQEQHQAPPVPTYDDAPPCSTSAAGYAANHHSQTPHANTYGSYDPPHELADQPRLSPFAADESYYSSPSVDPRVPPSPPPLLPSPCSSTTTTDRGVAGALAGGAAGAYAGHKLRHGILGALAGAFAGHKLEDALKQRRKQEQRDKYERMTAETIAYQQQQQQQQQQYAQHGYSAPPPGPPPAYSHQDHAVQSEPHVMHGNFSASSADISLDGAADLIARCRAVDGSERRSVLSLNRVLGNNDGVFSWVGNEGEDGNFMASARNVMLVQGGRVLQADLRDVDGNWRSAGVWLDERVGNHDGGLVCI